MCLELRFSNSKSFSPAFLIACFDVNCLVKCTHFVQASPSTMYFLGAPQRSPQRGHEHFAQYMSSWQISVVDIELHYRNKQLEKNLYKEFSPFLYSSEEESRENHSIYKAYEISFMVTLVAKGTMQSGRVIGRVTWDINISSFLPPRIFTDFQYPLLVNSYK